MALFTQRQDPIRLMKRRLLLLGLLLLIAIAVRGVWGVYAKLQESRVLRQEAESQLANLQAREANLRADISKLKSERGVEEVLREEYELAREGEGVVVIVQPQETKSEPIPTAFQRFTSWFGW